MHGNVNVPLFKFASKADSLTLVFVSELHCLSV